MAKVQVNPKQFMDSHVRPVCRRWDGSNPLKPAQSAYDALMVLIGGALDFTLTVDLPEVSLPGHAASPPPVAFPAAAVDPTQALNDIARAIKEAEKTLLGENLSIHNASVDVQLSVDVGGVAGATANFNLQIGPVPTD